MFGKNTKKREAAFNTFLAEVDVSINKLRDDFAAASAKPDAGARYLAFGDMQHDIVFKQKNNLKENFKANFYGNKTFENIGKGTAVIAGLGGMVSSLFLPTMGTDNQMIDTAPEYGMFASIGTIFGTGLTLIGFDASIKDAYAKYLERIDTALIGHDEFLLRLRDAREDLLNNDTDAIVMSPHFKEIIDRDPSLKNHFFAHSMQKSAQSKVIITDVAEIDTPRQKIEKLEL